MVLATYDAVHWRPVGDGSSNYSALAVREAEVSVFEGEGGREKGLIRTYT